MRLTGKKRGFDEIPQPSSTRKSKVCFLVTSELNITIQLVSELRMKVLKQKRNQDSRENKDLHHEETASDQPIFSKKDFKLGLPSSGQEIPGDLVVGI